MSSAWPSCGREKHHAVELAAESAATLEEFRVFCRLVIYEERGEPRGRVLQVVCFVEDEQGRAEARARKRKPPHLVHHRGERTPRLLQSLVGSVRPHRQLAQFFDHRQ